MVESKQPVKTRRAMHSYISRKARTASSVAEKRGWLLFRMWNLGHMSETFIALVQHSLTQAEQALQTEDDEVWRAIFERDKHVAQTFLAWVNGGTHRKQSM